MQKDYPLHKRCSGILLHPTSLPGGHGVGDLGPEAYRFADFLANAGQRLWQVLPLGPTGFGDSPYQSFSTFAGNPLLVSLDWLREEGYLSDGDLAGAPRFPKDRADFAAALRYKLPRLALAAERFESDAKPEAREEFTAFCWDNGDWLEDYTLFRALKEAHGGELVWTQWERGAALRDPAALALWREKLARPMAVVRFQQYQFYRQWSALRAYCRERGVRLMGDLPIYVAHDSADVWANPELFSLDPDGAPEFIAGVPPDYFSATGQRWGNPIYRWDVHQQTSFAWWVRRLQAVLRTVDIVRLDHFRGLEAYWEIPGQEPTAVNGRWVKGPGAALLDALAAATGGELPLVAENLGVITPEVEALRARYQLPGMAILQFGFGKDPQAPDFRPHNYVRNLVAYTGTHDNDTVVGWWNSSGAGDSTRTTEDVAKEKAYALRYLNPGADQIHWALIRTLLASVANLALIPLQDVLGLGSTARMNRPATLGGNWRWRCEPGACTPELAARLLSLTQTYER